MEKHKIPLIYVAIDILFVQAAPFLYFVFMVGFPAIVYHLFLKQLGVTHLLMGLLYAVFFLGGAGLVLRFLLTQKGRNFSRGIIRGYILRNIMCPECGREFISCDALKMPFKCHRQTYLALCSGSHESKISTGFNIRELIIR